jgi:hypothetical protein
MVWRDSLIYSLRVRFRVCCPPNQREAGGIAMRGEEKRFAHVVLFECPWCLRLLSSAFLSFDEQLRDQPDDPMGNESTTMCTCGWVGRALNMPSASHSVQPWSRAFAPSSAAEVATTDGIAEKRDWLFLVAKQIGSLSGQISERSSLNEG